MGNNPSYTKRLTHTERNLKIWKLWNPKGTEISGLTAEIILRNAECHESTNYLEETAWKQRQQKKMPRISLQYAVYTAKLWLFIFTTNQCSQSFLGHFWASNCSLQEIAEAKRFPNTASWTQAIKIWEFSMFRKKVLTNIPIFTGWSCTICLMVMFIRQCKRVNKKSPYFNKLIGFFDFGNKLKHPRNV